jgi:hypothetical protein
MKKIVMLAAIAAIATGCQTRLVAEKHPEQVTPIQRVVKVNGEDHIITTAAIVASGGWYATARSPLWAAETLRGLDLGVETNGTVYLRLDDYSRDLSTNAVAVVKSLTELTSDIAGKVTAALCTYYGGGAASATSSLGSLTVKDIYGKVQAKLAAKGVTDGNCSACDASAIAQEVCADCCTDCCTDGDCPAQ